jgi:GT2 family glycosyltransferase
MGCNMSLRRSVFAEVGGFAEDLGRIGRNPLGCEETELCIRVRQAYRRGGREARILFEPGAQVDHRVGAERVRWSYLRRRCWSEGLSKAAVARLVGSDDALSTERSYVATVLPRAVLRELRAGRVASAAAVVAALAATTAGYLRGRLPGATSEVRLPAAEGAVPAADAVVAGTGGA